MGEFERTVFIGNYKVPRMKLANFLQNSFGPCHVKEPMPPRSDGQVPFGFAIFENEEDAQSCLSMRRAVVDNIELVFSASKRGKGSASAGSGFQLGSSTSNGFGHRTPAAAAQPLPQQQQPNFRMFQGVLSHSKGVDNLYIQDLSGAAEYSNLQQELVALCQSAEVVKFPHHGQVCAALYYEDSSWYRCEILSKTSASEYLVQFIDFGNESTVKSDDLKQLTEAMIAMPPAAVRYHLKDVIAKADCVSQVNDMLKEWQEVVLNCQAMPDKSIELVNPNTCNGSNLRDLLLQSNCVTLGSLVAAEGGADSRNPNKKLRGKKPTADKGAGDSSTTQASSSQQKLEELANDNAYLKKQLSVATKKISQLAGRRSIDTLNCELSSKLEAVRCMRPKLRVAEDQILNHAITLLADDSPDRERYSAAVTPVRTAYTEYSNQQSMLRQLKPGDTLDDSMVEKRNEARAEFCQAIKLCQQQGQLRKITERRAQLDNILAKLDAFDSGSSTEPFHGDIEETIANFKQWQEQEGEKINEVQQNTEDALALLGKELEIIQQSLNLERAEVEAMSEVKIETATQLAISALQGELAVIDMSEGNPTFGAIKEMCCALRVKVGQELKLLSSLDEELTMLEAEATHLETYAGVTKPEKLEWMTKKEKKLKELRSQLLHRLADLDDLRENDDEPSATDVSDMEEQIDDLRDQIQLLLVEFEEYMDNLADLTDTVFPEFALQYPKLGIPKPDEHYIRPKRDIIFYKEDGSTLTSFNGKSVVIKTFQAPSGVNKYVPSVVKEIIDSSVLAQHVKVDAVFFCRTGRRTYIQLSSDSEAVLDYLRDTPVLSIESLIYSISNLQLSASTTDTDE
ncbi:serine/threonine-protein kinase 31-like [Watersipora subatra]|uniref:serine/threonine-protein kinase 31-like n=1 Tax=Watersipora subatra TaxID=2589382 RepID=UPI00355AD3A3